MTRYSWRGIEQRRPGKTHLQALGAPYSRGWIVIHGPGYLDFAPDLATARRYARRFEPLRPLNFPR